MSIVQTNGEAESSESAEATQTRPNGLTLPTQEEASEPSPTRPPTSAEIEAVIAAAMANAPPVHSNYDNLDGRSTPLMTNLLPAAVGADGRVNLFVGNLPYRVRWQDLKDLFRKAGTVLRADVSLGPENRSRGYGTVLMGSREDAARAIDRYNGFSWQTRTLEVRPDRLPPEYEPQQPINLNQGPNRGPMYPYNGNHHPHQGPPGPGWQRPPHMNHHPMTMANGPPMPGNGMYMPHHQPYLNGSIRSHSPALSFTQHGMPMQMPLSGQNTGSHGYGHMGASPLAGSLTVGGDPIARVGSSASNPHGISPHLAHLALPRAPSPALLGTGSRPPSSQGHHSASSHGSHTDGAGFARASFSSQGLPGDVPFPHRGSIDHGIVPHLEGLGQRGPGLGPPETLHDRVIFVSNLPLSMQWQELKDLLRPAGLIIRADVLTNAEGRPRGFGTALFGAVEDAARAVSMFNGCEIGGQRIRVILERDSQHHDPRRTSQSNSQSDASALGLGEPNGTASAPESAKETPVSSPSAQHRPAPRLATRVPWNLNLQNQSTPVRGSANGPDSTPRFRNFNPNMGPDSTPHFRQARHPGPIAMPPWNPNEYQNPLSPLQTRGLPPMTPSMPGFVFNNSYPETPPVPHHFMGPFSPGLPISSPNGFGFNPFLNPAPGAPIYRPQMGGSAQLGTPTTQAFPVNTARQYPGTPAAPGAPVGNQSNGDYFPSTIAEANENPSTPTSPPMAPRTASQQVLNARDRLAPSAPVSEQVNELIPMTASMSLNSLMPTAQGTPPTPTGRPKRSASNGNLSRLVSNGEKGDTLVDSEPSSPVNGRLSLDEQRPETNGNVDRRASFGDQR